MIIRSILEIPIPLPPPAEQHRIVAKLEELFSELDAGVGALRRAQSRLARYRQSLLQAAVTGELTREWREVNDKSNHHSRPSQDQAAKGGSGEWRHGPWQVPEGWRWVRFDEVFICRLGKMLDKQKNTGRPHPYLRNASVRWGAFDLSDLESIRVRDEELEEVSAQAGDLIICEGGEPGRCAVWKSGDPVVIQKALHRARPMAGVLSQFFAYHLEHDCLSTRINELFTGTTIQHLTGRKLAEHLVVLPPEPEQHAILAELDRRLSAADVLDTTFQASLRRADRLRQSILARAFCGDLVPQDPNDEPAEALLARLKAAAPDTPAPRRRGRPPKAESAEPHAPRRRGRPRKAQP